MIQKKTDKKILIFIVAYNAEKHIESVLKRIPASFFEDYEYEILIIDDSSKDNTFEVAKRFQKNNINLNLKVLYNPVNQGYGGNQKLGYRYAIRNGFDVVVLLHGDGQYAPELVEDMITPLVAEEANAVFGSRMMEKKNALKGGMPLYKYVGNIILTRLQNKILKASLSEFHSGYRAYDVHALARLPFERNSNDFHFDTQIIIQFLTAKFIIKEIPIPTFYGDEICNVDGIKYGRNVIKESILSRMHKLNIFYKIEYDIDDDTPIYDIKLGYTSSHTMAIDAIEDGSTVLDIGCGEGLLAREVKKKNCTVHGIDMIQVKNQDIFERYQQMNLDNPDFNFSFEPYDYILLLDIIEHLGDPEGFLDYIREKSGLKQPVVVMTTPNIAFFITRMQLFFGNFNYGKRGILDLTHKRLFTFSSMKRLCEQTGYQIIKLRGVPGPFPKALGKNWLSMFLLRMNRFLIGISKRLFSYQIYIEIQPTPVVERLLEYSIQESKRRAQEPELEKNH